MKRNITKYVSIFVAVGFLASCNDFLDKEPQSSISPDLYLTEESQLATYANGLYTDVLPGHLYNTDDHTDNQANFTYNNRYIPGQWRTTQSQSMDDDSYRFKFIYSCNYFLENVLPRYNAGEISGDDTNIRQYIGEIYFLRAHEYFKNTSFVPNGPEWPGRVKIIMRIINIRPVTLIRK